MGKGWEVGIKGKYREGNPSLKTSDKAISKPTRYKLPKLYGHICVYIHIERVFKRL